MKIKKVQIKGIEVEIQFLEEHGDAHVGFATHAVPSDDLDYGNAGGPSDGETFVCGGKAYRLGAHDYETYDDETICTARIYTDSAE